MVRLYRTFSVYSSSPRPPQSSSINTKRSLFRRGPFSALESQIRISGSSTHSTRSTLSSFIKEKISNLSQIGHHYYNPKKNIAVPQHKLDLWPGFITSILQYEDNIVLCADVSHKIMRSGTVYDTLNQLHQNSRNFHEGAIRQYMLFCPKTGETRCEGCLCTSSGWFKHIEHRRTFPNHIITEIARCVEFCHMSSGWFDCTEPSLTTIFTGEARCAGCLCTSSKCTPCFPCNDVDREGSVWSNHPELM